MDLELPNTYLVCSFKKQTRFVVKCHIQDSFIEEIRQISESRPGLDIGYVPAGSHAFLRLSGQFRPPQISFFFFSASYAAIIFTGNRQNSEGNVNSYLFFVIYRPNVQKCATSRVKS